MGPLTRLVWAAFVVADTGAFLPAPSRAPLEGWCKDTVSTRLATRLVQPGPRSLQSRQPARRHQRQRSCALLAKKGSKGSAVEDEEGDEDASGLEEFRLAKLAEWKSLMDSGELEEITKEALEMDVIEQEEALEGAGTRRTGRKNRRKESHPDVADLDSFFDKETDWRDVASAGSADGYDGQPSSSPRKRRSAAAAASLEGAEVDFGADGDDFAAKLAAGLGLRVVGGNAGQEEDEEDYEEEIVEEEEETYDEGFAGIGLGGVSERDDGVRDLMRAIRREEKSGKDAEKVIAMVVSAAERDGARDDELFAFALKSLARMGRLDLSLRVNEMRQRYLVGEELENHDRMTTAGLAVACLRTGDEALGLEIFDSAVRPALAVDAEGTAGGVVDADTNAKGEEDEEEEEDWAMLEAEQELKEILQVEGEVLPELLGHYLDRLQKDSSQEAAVGVRRTIDRALRKGDFGADVVPASSLTQQQQLHHRERHHLPVGAYNQLIRRLGKADRLSDVFEVLDGMTDLGVESDHETLEFVTNAAVKEVEFETRAVSMKGLPSGNAALPEVVFVGRSNVGKSSLVNMLVNRKALAPTSAVPGFTQHFNYYAVNKGRRKSPSFFLVDVPGLGYARADDGRVDSWKSTLQRYLGVRESLRVVFHLVDVRTGFQKADEQLISLMMEENKGRSSYVMVLTKCDKVSNAKRASVTEEIRQALHHNGFPSSVPVIATSAKSRQGRVELWSYLRLMFDVDRRRGKGRGKGGAAAPTAQEAGTEAAQQALT